MMDFYIYNIYDDGKKKKNWREGVGIYTKTGGLTNMWRS